MIDLDSLLKNSFVISISQDKFRTFSTIFRKRGLPGVRLFRGFDDADMTGKKKCGISHAAIVKMAQSLDLPYVCVFEDDAYPRIDAAEMLADELRRVDDGTDVLILGWCNNI